MTDAREPEPRTDVGRAERIALTFIVSVILVLGAIVVTGPEERLAFLFYDDAYYYYVVAEHLARGDGSTFDGIHRTNGYHPLWCWLLVPVFRVVSDAGGALRVVAAVWFALAATAPWAVWRLVRPRTGGTGAVIAAALFALQPWVGLGLWRANGLETPLYAVVLALAAGAFERRVGRGDAAPGLGSVAILGLFTGAAILSRLDAGFFAVAMALVMTVHLARRHGPGVAVGRVVVLAAAATAVAGPSLVWNVARFDHPVPVSGRMASHYAGIECDDLGGPASADCLRRRAGYAVRTIPLAVVRGLVGGTPLERPLARAGAVGGALALLGGTALVGWGIARRRRRGPPGSDAVVLLAVFVAMHYVVHGVWLWTSGESSYRLYYLMPESMLLAVAAGAAFGPALERRVSNRRVLAAGLTVVLAAMGANVLRQGILRWAESAPDRRPVSERHIYGWIRDTLPRDAVLGARDAGKLGYFAGRAVVNLDGLINDQHLLDALWHDRMDDYLHESPVRFLLYDRPWVDYDPARPDDPPAGEVGRALHRLHLRPDCSLREVPGATDDWLVLEVVRDP